MQKNKCRAKGTYNLQITKTLLLLVGEDVVVDEILEKQTGAMLLKMRRIFFFMRKKFRVLKTALRNILSVSAA